MTKAFPHRPRSRTVLGAGLLVALLSIVPCAGDGVPTTILESNQADDGSFDSADFGGGVDAAGDVNGDGFADVVVGARGWDLEGGLFDEGAAFVFLGGPAGVNPTPSTIIQSTQATSELGQSVAGAGDVNGDGFDDIVVGSHFWDGILPGTQLRVDGAAFVFHGGPSGITATDPGMADATIRANQIDSFLGFSVAGAGDVNGDGFDDIVVGVPRQGSPTFPPNIPPNEGQGTGGAALIFHGGPSGITGTGFSDADAVLLPYPPGAPEPSTTLMGAIVAGVGDVNGDGFDDVAMNALGIVVFLGSPSGIVGTDPSTAHAYLAGPATVVSAAGDVNNDGFADILVGQPNHPNITPGLPLSFSGAFGVFLGSPAGITATDLGQAQTTVTGTIENQQLGYALAAAGDIDQDGFDDILVGALGYAGSLDQEGAAYVFRGGPTGIDATTLLDAYLRLESGQSQAARRLNRHELDVAGIGDADLDGFADTALGLGFYDVDQLNEGAVFVYHGAPAPAVPNDPPVALAGADQLVYDVDGDLFESVTVDGSASFDPDGSIVAWAWYEGETLLGTSPVVSAVLPASGNHTLTVTVTDDAGITRGDPVVVRVDIVDTAQVFWDDFTSLAAWETGGDVALSGADSFPTPPQARLGAAGAFLRRTVSLPAGATGLTLDFWAKASQFAAGDELRVNVSVDGGPFTTIRTFTAADSTDQYVFYGGSAIPLGHSWFPATASSVVLEFESGTTTGRFFVDDVVLTALLAPTGGGPVANAGPDQSVGDADGDGQETVTLDGSASTAPGAILSWEWREGGELLATGVAPTVSLAPGVHPIVLTVTDDTSAADTDTVTVTVQANQPPVADAGADQTMTDADGDGVETVVVDGSASFDVDGAIASYAWSDGTAVLGTAEVLATTLALGTHVLELTVTDDGGAASTDTVSVTVNPAAGGPAPAEAQALRIQGHDPATGNVSIVYTPACRAADHNIVYGPLDDVGSYAYSGQVCNIGTSGSYTQLAPGPGSWFFLVVGTDGVGTEGSYGASSDQAERPEDLGDPVCSYTQQIGAACGTSIALQLTGVPATIPRGDLFTLSATVRNDGATTVDGLTAEVDWTPPDPLRLESPQTTTQSYAPLPPAGQQTAQWELRADRAGTSTITVTLRDAASAVVATAGATVQVED